MSRLLEEAFLRRVCVWLMLAAWWPASASALTLDELSYGEHVIGPNLTPAQLRGKVVLVDFWGTECPPCIRQLPMFQTIYNKYREDGFHIVAMERQRHSMQDVIAFVNDPGVQAMGLMYQITCGDVNSPTPPNVPGRYTPMLPANFLFGPDGNLVATDLHDDALERAISEQLLNSWSKLIDPGETVRFKEQAAKLKSGQGMMAALSELAVRKRDSKDPAEVAEATRLMYAVFAAAKKKIERAQTMRDSDPVGAFYKFGVLAVDLKGTQIAEQALKAAEELRSNDRVVAEHRAEAEMKSIITHIADLKPSPAGSRVPDDPGFRAANAVELKTLESECQRVFYKYPGTRAGEHVRKVTEDFKLNLGL